MSVTRPSSTFSKHFSSESTDPISIKFHMQPPGKEGKKIYIFGPGHMTKMATMPIYGKNVKNLLLQNHLVDCFETWYVASGELIL